MSLVRDFIELITAYPGALVYHLVTLFAIQLIVGVALGHWRRQGDEPSTRLLIMGLGLFLARALLMLTAVLGSLGLVSSPAVFPPLERFLDLTTSLLVLWAFLPILNQNPRAGTMLLLVTVLLAAGTYAAFASLWPGAAADGTTYVGHWQERVWELSNTVILVVALVASLVWRGRDWGWLVCLLGLWLAGHSLQLIAPAPTGNAGGWTRLTDLIGLPLLAALIYRRALRAAESAEPTEEDARRGALGILEAVRRIKVGDDLDPSLKLAATSIATTLNADMALVGLMTRNSTDRLRVAALHAEESVLTGAHQPTVSLTQHPVLATAAHRQRLERVTDDRSVSQAKGLYHQLGVDTPGPLLVHPLMANDKVVGLILVGNPESQRVWRRNEERMLQAIALVLAPALAASGGR